MEPHAPAILAVDPPCPLVGPAAAGGPSQVLLECFKDASWTVRDVACEACTHTVRSLLALHAQACDRPGLPEA